MMSLSLSLMLTPALLRPDLDASYSIDLARYQGEDRIPVGKVLGRVEGPRWGHGRDQPGKSLEIMEPESVRSNELIKLMRSLPISGKRRALHHHRVLLRVPNHDRRKHQRPLSQRVVRRSSYQFRLPRAVQQWSQGDRSVRSGQGRGYQDHLVQLFCESAVVYHFGIMDKRLTNAVPLSSLSSSRVRPLRSL